MLSGVFSELHCSGSQSYPESDFKMLGQVTILLPLDIESLQLWLDKIIIIQSHSASLRPGSRIVADLSSLNMHISHNSTILLYKGL